MIPLSDDRVYNAGKPYMTWLLLVINLIVYYFEWQLDAQGLDDFILTYGATPISISNGLNIQSLLTSIFLHGGILHLLSNMLFLYIFGDNVEAVMGHFSFLMFYLLGGIVGTLIHIDVNPISISPLVGASGAISAIMGAYIVLFPKSKITTFIIIFPVRVSAYIFLGLWAIMQLIEGFHVLQLGIYGESNVAIWAHIGGLFFGIIGGLLYRRVRKNLITDYELRLLKEEQEEEDNNHKEPIF